MRTKTILIFCLLYFLGNLFLLTEYPHIAGDVAGYIYSALAFKDTLRLQVPGVYYFGLNEENRALPPLYMLFLGGFFLFFGFGIYQARIFALFIGTSIIFLFIRYAPLLIKGQETDKKRLDCLRNRFQIILALLLFFNPFFLTITRLSSPAIFALLFVVLGILIFFFSLQMKKTGRYIASFVSGMFMVLGTFSHQYVSFIFIAMLITLFFSDKKKRMRTILSFALVPFIIFLFYAFFLFDASPDLKNWYFEQRTPRSFAELTNSFLHEPLRFMYWPSALFTFLFFLLLFFADFFLDRKRAVFFQYKSLFLLLFFLFILFAVIEKKKVAHYFIYYYPFLILYTGIALNKFFDKKKWFALLLLTFYLFCSLLLITHKFYSSFDRDFSAFCKELLPLLPSQGKIIVDDPASLCLKDKERIFLITETTIPYMSDRISLLSTQNVTAAVFVNISQNESAYGTTPSHMPYYEALKQSIKDHCTEKASIKEPFYGRLFHQRLLQVPLVVYSCNFNRAS